MTPTKKIILIEEKMIEEYKWIESEKAEHDLGETCCLEWVKKYAKKVRDDLSGLSLEDIDKLFKKYLS